MSDTMRDLLWNFGSYVVLAIIAWIATRLVAKRILDYPRFKPGLMRLRPVRWTGYEVLLAFLAWRIVPIVLVQALRVLGVFGIWPGGAPNPDADDAASSLAGLRLLSVCSPLSTMAVLALLFTVLFARHGVRPHHFGLSWSRWPIHVGLGLTFFIWITPVVLAIHVAATWVLWNRPQGLSLLGQAHLAWWEWGFLAFYTCAAAPLLEEILFRGLLQNWLRQASFLGHISVIGATIWLGVDNVRYDDPSTGSQVLDAGPLVFAVLLAGVYAAGTFTMKFQMHEIAEALAAERDREEPDITSQFVQIQLTRRLARLEEVASALSIFGSAMLFAMFHASAWPAPIALFVLGLGLGTITWGSQYLLGPIVLHAAFNLVAFIALFGSTHYDVNGNEQTRAARPSVVSSVPVSQWPLRK